jgi:hypothetical protein
MDISEAVRRNMLLAETVRVAAMMLNAAILAAAEGGLLIGVEVDGGKLAGDGHGSVPSIVVIVDRA